MLPAQRKSVMLSYCLWLTSEQVPGRGAGASDCASCVGVLLEVARATIADPRVSLAAPLVVLLNGGEETFLQVQTLSGQLLLTLGRRCTLSVCVRTV